MIILQACASFWNLKRKQINELRDTIAAEVSAGEGQKLGSD